MKVGRVFLFAFALVLVAGLSVSAQQFGSITGTVMDPQGAVIPGAKVTVREQQTNQTYNSTADDKGNFDLPALPFGVYVVTIEAGGFRKWETTGARVIVGQPTIIRATMEVGSVSETVTVEAASEVVNTVSPELQHNVDRRQMLNLPLPARNPVDFVSLQPGFQSPAGVRSGRVHGLRGQTNNITQDGINAQDNVVRTDGQFALTAPTTDQIGEISISTGTVGSDSGAGVAQIRFTTQKGTNDFHGTIFYNHRNDALNANTWENNQKGNKADGTPVSPKERLRQHTFGINSGGPVWLPKIYNGRDKTFFFARYEGFRENFSATRNRTVLTQAARTGVFTYRTNCSSTGNPACPAGVTNGQVISVNLLTNPAFNTRGLTANPITTALIGATPLPNNATGGDGLNTMFHSFDVVGTDPNNRYNIRIDHKLIDKSGWGTHWLEVNWSWGSFVLTPDTFNSIEPAFPEGIATSCVDGVCQGAMQSSKRKLLAVALHSQLGPTMFNEVRGGFQRAPVGFIRTGTNPRAFNLTFPGIITNPEQNFLSQGRIAPFYTFIDNFSKVKGSHTLKFGYDFSSTNGILFNDAGTRPTVTLGRNSVNDVGFLQTTFNSIGSLDAANLTRAQNLMISLTGLVTSSAQTFNLSSPDSGFVPGATRQDWIRERAHMGYAMDIWRAFPSLTLTFGTRYEYVAPADVVNGVIAMPTGNQLGFFQPYSPFDPFTIDPSITVSQVRTGTAATTQLELVRRNRLWDSDRNNFAPFLGMAYSPNSDNRILGFLLGKGGKGAVRGGFSTSFTRDGITVATNARTNNTGAAVGVSRTNLTGVIGSGGFPLTTPTFSEPISQISNFMVTGGGSNIFTFDRDLRTPYVLQWSLGIEREIMPQTRFEIRYVGNHAVKLYRGLDLNQIGLLDNGMLNEFLAAKTNLACNRTANISSWANRGTSCNVPLPIMTMLGPTTDPVLANQFTSATRIQNLDQNRAGEWAHQLSLFAFLNHFGVASFAQCVTPGSCVPGLGSMPFNFFRANPMILNGIVIGNHAHSNYNAVEMEIFRRFSRGFLLQGNYTFAKTITDADGASQNEFFPHLSLTDPRRERTRASFDITHTFNANGIWEIPVGRGRRYLSGGIIGKVLEGWQAGGIWRWFSGRPTSILSERGTLNRDARGLTQADFAGGIDAQKVCDDAGIYKVPQGSFWLPNEYLRNPGGNTTTGANLSLFAHPGAGSLGSTGNLLKCNGPGFFRVDMNFIKRTYITEQVHFEFRAEFFNLFNNPNFRTSTQNFNIDGTRFGGLTSVDTSREIQFNFRIGW